MVDFILAGGINERNISVNFLPSNDNQLTLMCTTHGERRS